MKYIWGQTIQYNGEKRKVALAACLAYNPKIVILDEPTVGLDPKQVADIREVIKKLGEKHTVILSSHILSEVSQICEKVIIIELLKFEIQPCNNGNQKYLQALQKQ